MKQFFKRMLFAVLFCVPWVVGAQTHYNLQVGSGTATNQYLPNYTYYNYAYSQMLYSANEIGIDGVIDTLAFQVSSGGTTRSLTIYMAEVSQTTLSSQIAPDQFHQVFSGSVTWAAGWIPIALDTVFEYQDTGSLVIAVIDGTGSYVSSPYYQGTSMSDTRSMYIYSDYDTYTLATQMTSNSSFLPNLRLGITSNSSYCAAPSDVAITNIDFDSAHISWVENGTASSWALIVSDSVITDFDNASPIVVSENQYTITGLEGNTPYYVYVCAVCDGSSSSAYTTATYFRSACIGSQQLPYFTGFEDAEDGMPNCWSRLATGTSSAGTFPATYNYATNARNGNVYFEFESTSGQTEIAVLPQVDDINTLQVEFYASCMNTNFTLELGVIEEDSIFVPVDTVALTAGVGNNWHNSYYPYTVYFDQYSGSGSNMAMRVKGIGSYTLMIDDLTISEIPGCLPPTNFAVESLGGDWAGLQWVDDNGTSWEIIYDTLPINLATTELSSIVANENNIVLTGLVAGKQYTAYLRGDCGSEYSPWVGPLTFTPGQYNMRFSGTDTMSICGLTIYDDGGADGEYSVGANSMLVLYPSSEDSLITFYGSTNLYYYYAHLRIYDGVGTNGTILWQSASSYDETIPVLTSFSGPITIQFNGGSYQYGYEGFEIHTSCVAAPQCAAIQDLQVESASVGSAYVTWSVSGLNLGVPTGYDVECYDTLGVLVYNGVSTETHVMISGLDPASPYKVRVRTVCDDDNAGAFDSTTFTTFALACVEMNMANSHFDTIGNGTSTSNYFPTYTCYNYSLTQQIYKASELNGGGSLTSISFMPQSVASPNGTSRNIEIYVAHISDSTAATFVYPSDLTLVYSGSPTFVADEWCEIQFDQSFAYNGTDHLFVMFRDLTGVYSCSNNWYVHTADNNASHYVYQDGSSYPIGSTGGYSSSERMNAVFGFVECTQLADCAAPIVVVDSVATDFVSISWGAGYQETSWIVEYRVDSVNTWTVAGTTSNSNWDFNNLGVNTRYHFRVGAVCSDTTLYASVSALTKCGAEPLPFINGFESFPTSGYPSCWYKASNYSYGEYPSVSTSYSHAGSNSLYMYSSQGSYSYIVLPELDAPLDTLELNLWMYATASGYPNELFVGVMTDVENVNSFQNVGIVSPSQLNVWEPAKVRFSNYTGNGTRIAIMSPASDYVNFYIDDIAVNIVSPCASVETVSTEFVSSDSAVVVWDSLEVSAFEYVFGESGFALDSAIVEATTENRAYLGNLSPNTQYDIYVRVICGDGDTSNWSNALSFRTECVAISAVPFFESFENNVSGWSSSSSSNFYPCWYRNNNPSTSYWYPYVYNYDAYSGNNSLYWSYDNSANFSPYITMPAIDTNAIDISAMMLSFWAKNGYSNYTPTVVIGTMTNPQAILTFQALDTVVFTNTNFTKYEIPLNNYNGHGEYITILPTGGSYWYGYMDDISLDSIPSCMHVTDLAVTGNTSSSVSIAWTELGTATTWEIAVDTDPTATPVADTTVTGTSAATINGLVTGTSYYFWVRSVCSATDASAWEGPVMSIPGSWFMIPNQTDTVVMCGGVITDDGGPAGEYSSSQDSYVIIRPDTPGALVSVSGTSYTEGNYDHLHIYDGEGTSGVELWNDYGVTSNQTFGPFVSNSGSITLYFHSDGSVVYDGYVVNVSCVTDNCPVSDLMLDTNVALSSNSLALTWTGSSTSYDVAYGPSGIDVDSATFLNTTTNSITIGGLNSITSYDVFVRGLCNAGDTGMWHMITLRTSLCDNATVVENWDTTMSSTTSGYAPVGYSFYNYSYVQTIVDSAFFAGLENEITALEFQPSTTTAGGYFTHMTVYMANVSESDLSNNFILPDDSAHIFVPVIVDRDMSYSSTDWQMHGFDSTFVWDGHSNVLIAFNREHGTYSSGSGFNAHNTSSAKTRYVYQDSYPFDPTSVTGGSTLTMTGDLRFYSCGAACAKPTTLPATNITYNSATVNWNSSATDFEVAVKAASDATWPAEVSVSNATSYAVNNLLPATQYQFRVRTICDATEGLISDWTEGVFVTDSLPCFVPTDLHTTDLGYTTATLAWTAGENQNQWSVQVWNSSTEPIDFAVSGNATTTVTGLAASTQYYAAVKAICGGGLTESEYSDTISFTTNTCAQVTGVTVNGITAHTAVVSWTPMGVSTYKIEYGDRNFNEGNGTTVVVNNATSYTLTGLEEDYEYTVFVKAVCEEGVEGVWSDQVNFDTPEEGGVSVNTVDGAMNLSIYPNPTSNATTIAVSGVNGEVSITIVDMNGRTVAADSMSCEGDCTKRMEVSGLAQGAYFVRVSGEGLNQVRKLVVK